LQKSSPSRSTAEEDFYEYTIDVNTTIFQGTYSSIYLAAHSSSPGVALVGRVYEPTARILPHTSAFLKVLKHIGKRSPHCIATWDIYFDDANRVVIFQEFALLGNLKDRLRSQNIYVPEDQLHQWAGQIYQAMDFLGDCGICHRAITPKHILITPSAEDPSKTVVKLGSFRDSFIYFDPKEGRVRMQPCLDKKQSVNNSFMAPEVFDLEGTRPPELSRVSSTSSQASTESCVSKGRIVKPAESRADWQQTEEDKDKDGPDREYDPIAADVWSYAACFFFANTRYFAVKYSGADGNPGPTIQKTINYAKNLSPEAKSWFSGLLKPDPSQRTSFNQIADHPWFKKGPAKDDNSMQ